MLRAAAARLASAGCCRRAAPLPLPPPALLPAPAARPPPPPWATWRGGSTSCGDNRNIDYILEGNADFIRRHKRDDPHFFDKLGSGQAPKYLYIGCSDSRVAAEDMLGMGPGSMFVHRNIANMVVSTDMSMLSVLQYAVQVLEVPHIIVCGHYDCGGVKAAMQRQDLGLIENWLRGIRDVYRLHEPELNGIADGDARFRRLVELNVMEQVIQVYKTGIVQGQRAKTLFEKNMTYATPRVHGLVFDPATGQVHKLPIDFRRDILPLAAIYDLHDAPSSPEPEPSDLDMHKEIEIAWDRR